MAKQNKINQKSQSNLKAISDRATNKQTNPEDSRANLVPLWKGTHTQEQVKALWLLGSLG